MCIIKLEFGLGFAHSFVPGMAFFSDKHNAGTVSFSQNLFQTNLCFIGVNLL